MAIEEKETDMTKNLLATTEPLTQGIDDYVRDVEVARSNRVAPTFEGCPAATLVAVVRGEANAAYHARPELSTSSLRVLGKSPAQFHRHHVLRHKSHAGTEATQYGTKFHSFWEIGPSVFWDVAKRVPAKFCTGSGGLSTKQDAQDWVKEQGPDAILVTPSDEETLRAQHKQAMANRAFVELWEQVAEKEISIIWKRASGTGLRCRPDAVLEDGRLIDFKTTRDQFPLKQWWHSCREYGYGLQAAVYREGASLAGFSDEPMTFVVASTVGECEVHCVTLPRRFVLMGQRKLDRLIEEYEDRMALDSWVPSSYGAITELYMPPHVYGDEE